MAKDYFLEAAAKTENSNAEIIQKFGLSDSVGTTFTPLTIGNIYRTPQSTGATTLRIKAGNVADTALGLGARAIYIEGLNAAGELTHEILNTAGASASSVSVNSYMRLYRAYVCESGTYATASAGSHVADIVIENSAGTEDWATIRVNGMAVAQSEIGAYTVPKGKEAYILGAKVSVDTTKITSVLFFKRENILETAAPYTAMRKQLGSSSIVRDYTMESEAPHGVYPELTDIGFMAKVSSGTATVEVEFDILLRDKA